MRRFLTVMCAGLSFGAWASCSARYPTAPASRQAVAMQVQYAAPTPDPRVGTPASFVAYAVDADGAWTDVTTQATWYASDSSIVRVSSGSATVLAVGEGTASVIASYGGITSSAPIAVRPAAITYPWLDFVPIFAPIRIGDYGYVSALTRQDSATGSTNIVTNQAVLALSDPTVISMPSSAINGYFGLVGLAIGTTRITATIGGQSISLNVSVAPRRN